MNDTTPVVFADGTQFYENLAKTYIRHSTGLFILAPSGSGKTFFVRHQTEKHWIDGDYLWPASGADMSDEGWNSDMAAVEEINIKSDVITVQAKKLGFWVVGSSNSFLKPDAIVIPDWETHMEFIRHRENSEYDGGATQADLEAVASHRELIGAWERKGVPCFTSVEEAAANLGHGLA